MAFSGVKMRYNAFQGISGDFRGLVESLTDSWTSFTKISGEFQIRFKGLQCISEHFKAIQDVSDGFSRATRGLHKVSCELHGNPK